MVIQRDSICMNLFKEILPSKSLFIKKTFPLMAVPMTTFLINPAGLLFLLTVILKIYNPESLAYWAKKPSVVHPHRRYVCACTGSHNKNSEYKDF